MEGEVMDLHLTLNRLQGNYSEFQQEQSQTNKQIYEMSNALNSKFDAWMRTSTPEIFSVSLQSSHDNVKCSKSDAILSLAENLPKWYRFDLSMYDRETDPKPWICRCEQFF